MHRQDNIHCSQQDLSWNVQTFCMLHFGGADLYYVKPKEILSKTQPDGEKKGHPFNYSVVLTFSLAWNIHNFLHFCGHVSVRFFHKLWWL